MQLTIVITDYNTNLEWISELDNSLKQLDVEFDIVRVSNNSVYKFTSTTAVTELFCEAGNVSKAKNIGLQAATGEYVLMIDNDDMLLHGNIKQYLGFDVILPKYGSGLLKKQFNGTIIRRELIQKYNLRFLDIDYYEDYYIVYKLYYEKTHTLTTIAKPFYYYRRNPNGICNTSSASYKIRRLEQVKTIMLSMKNINAKRVMRDIEPNIDYWKQKL